MQDQIIIQSPERIVHFQCPVCEGWWSVGDAPEREYWFCTWCGKRALTKGGTVPVAMLRRLWWWVVSWIWRKK